MSNPPSYYNFPGSPVTVVDPTDSAIKAAVIEGGKMRVSSKAFLYDIAENEITGHTGHRASCFCPDIDNTEITLWPGPAGLYVFPAAAQQMEVVSSDNTNDKAGGTGALTIMVHYLDASFHAKEELITLTGTTPVATVATDIYRVNCIHLASAGSTGKAAGNIDIRNLADTPVYGRIQAGRAVCQSSVYTIPDGTVDSAYLTSWHIGIGAAAAGHYGVFRLLATTSPMGTLLPNIFFAVDQVVIQDGHVHIPLEFPWKCLPGTDIMITGVSDAAGANAVASGAYTFYSEPVGGV